MTAFFGDNLFLAFVCDRLLTFPHKLAMGNLDNYSWLSERERSYISFGFKAAAAAAFFSETSILNNFEVYTPFSKLCFLCFAVLKCQTVFDLYVDL